MLSLLDVHESLNWVFFDSSALNAAAYLPTERLLYLEFHSGERYRYFDFPPEQYRDLLAAESKGTYFGQHIRDRFRFERLPQTRSAGG
jgi:hypothetical protein